MSERRFEQSMRPEKHIERELSDSGISDPSEWRKALDAERQNFEKLLTYLEGDKRIPDKEKIKQFSETHDSIERLEILHSMSLADAVACIRDYAEVDGSYRYLAGRLDFYQKLIQGQAVQRQTEREWNSQKGEIDASSANSETIRIGLLRDVEFASMKGTPEFAIYQITEKRLKEKNARTKHLLPALKGFGSGIGVGGGRWLTRYLWLNLENSDDRAQSERIGYGYTFLRKTFEESKALIVQKRKGEPLDEEALEHRAVIQAANWLEEATNYNDPSRPLGSPYIGSIQESIAWARLGDPNVKKQLRGMRVKIQESDLRNIGRFIGKSGVNRYEGEHKRLFGQIKFLKEGYDQKKKQEFTIKENNFAVQKQDRWLARETEKANRWLEKYKTKIATYDIPDSERQEILDSVQRRYDEKKAEINSDYSGQVDQLSQRSPDELLVALQERQRVVDQRYEKRKSLAQKALDLHFALSHEGGDYGSKPLGGLVDWINYAPLETIKRSHRLLKQGASEELIITHALVDIIIGKRAATPEDMKVVQTLVQKAKGQDYDAQQKLREMSKMRNILSMAGYEISLQEVADIADKNFSGMAGLLKKYNLEQVKQFIDAGINLQSLTIVKEVIDKLGHNLGPQEVAEMAAHNIDGLENAFKIFNLDEVRVLLRQDVYLPVAAEVLNNTKQFGYELDINQIASLTKNVNNDVNGFISALRELPFAEVEKIFSDGISYDEYNRVKEALAKHQYDFSFIAVHSLAKKLTKTREDYNLDSALDTFNLKEIEQIKDKGSIIKDILEVGNAFKKKQISTNLQELILFEKYAGNDSKGDDVMKAIDTFGINDARKIVAKGCRLDKAVEVNNYMRNSGYGRSRDAFSAKTIEEVLTKGGIEAIIAIAKAGSPEVALKTIEAGFTVEEITKFPFLISPLVTKK